MLTANPTVSVIIAAYNAEPYIRACIESILRQGYRDLEAVVVDDGSTDGTGRILDLLAGDDARVRVIHGQNAGPAKARNEAFLLSRGRYVVIMDADDLMLPGKIESQVRYLETHPDISVAYTDSCYCDERGNQLPGLSGSGLSKRPEGDVFPDIIAGNFITVHAAMVRRECLETVGLHDDRSDLIGDWDLWTRVAARYRFAHLEPPGVVYRIHPSMSASQHQLDRQRRQREATMDRIAAHPRFRLLSGRARAGYHYSRGRFLMAAGAPVEARRHLWEAVRGDPLRTKHLVACLFGWCGANIFRRMLGAVRALRLKRARNPAPPLRDPF